MVSKMSVHLARPQLLYGEQCGLASIQVIRIMAISGEWGEKKQFKPFKFRPEGLPIVVGVFASAIV